jgi:hypothetical protein
MQFMDNVKMGDKINIGILDPTCVNQASHAVNLRKESEMYKDIKIKQFNKEVVDLSKNSLYIVKAMHAFVKGGKTTIKIPHFFK